MFLIFHWARAQPQKTSCITHDTVHNGLITLSGHFFLCDDTKELLKELDNMFALVTIRRSTHYQQAPVWYCGRILVCATQRTEAQVLFGPGYFFLFYFFNHYRLFMPMMATVMALNTATGAEELRSKMQNIKCRRNCTEDNVLWLICSNKVTATDSKHKKIDTQSSLV